MRKERSERTVCLAMLSKIWETRRKRKESVSAHVSRTRGEIMGCACNWNAAFIREQTDDGKMCFERVCMAPVGRCDREDLRMIVS